jgi:hypothetical protein
MKLVLLTEDDTLVQELDQVEGFEKVFHSDAEKLAPDLSETEHNLLFLDINSGEEQIATILSRFKDIDHVSTVLIGDAKSLTGLKNFQDESDGLLIRPLDLETILGVIEDFKNIFEPLVSENQELSSGLEFGDVVDKTVLMGSGGTAVPAANNVELAEDPESAEENFQEFRAFESDTDIRAVVDRHNVAEDELPDLENTANIKIQKKFDAVFGKTKKPQNVNIEDEGHLNIQVGEETTESDSISINFDTTTSDSTGELLMGDNSDEIKPITVKDEGGIEFEIGDDDLEVASASDTPEANVEETKTKLEGIELDVSDSDLVFDGVGEDSDDLELDSSSDSSDDLELDSPNETSDELVFDSPNEDSEDFDIDSLSKDNSPETNTKVELEEDNGGEMDLDFTATEIDTTLIDQVVDEDTREIDMSTMEMEMEIKSVSTETNTDHRALRNQEMTNEISDLDEYGGGIEDDLDLDSEGKTTVINLADIEKDEGILVIDDGSDDEAATVIQSLSSDMLNELSDTSTTIVTILESEDETQGLTSSNYRATDEELLKTSATIKHLREERDIFIKDIEDLRSEKKLSDQEKLGYRSEIDELKIELQILKKRYQDDVYKSSDHMRTLEDKKTYYETKYNDIRKDLEKVQQKLRIDMNKVHQKEKELEGQLEMLRMDSESQVQGRELKILDLKRTIDSLEFNMENIAIQEQKAREDKVKLEVRLNKMMKTLRGSIKVLEEDLDIDDDLRDALNKLS